MKNGCAALAMLAMAGCTPPPVINVNDGFSHVAGAGTFSCNGPTAVDGSHKDVTLEGACRTVRVTGSHVDLVAYVEPGATIEVTGSRDTVVYRLLRRGPPPRWLNRGDGNELIRNSRAPWEQDHDWYQERH